MGGLIVLVCLFTVVGFAIAAAIGKNNTQIVVLGVVLSIGLMFVAVGVVFAGCAIAASHGGGQF